MNNAIFGLAAGLPASGDINLVELMSYTMLNIVSCQ